MRQVKRPKLATLCACVRTRNECGGGSVQLDLLLAIECAQFVVPRINERIVGLG